MGIASTSSEVEISETRRVSSESATVSYRITPPGTERVRASVVVDLPEPVPRSTVSFSGPDAGQWEYEAGNQMVFTSELTDSDAVEAGLRIRSPRFDPDDCESTVTVTTGPTAEAPTDGVATDGVADDGVADDGVANGGTAVWSGGGSGPLLPDGETDPGGVPSDAADGPAVAVVATGDNDADVTRTVLRATEHEVPVVVAVADGEVPPAARLADRLGAAVVETGDADPSDDGVATALSVAARHRGYSGVVFHGAAEEPLALEASLEAFDDVAEPVVDAVPERARTTVLAGVPAYDEAEAVGEVVAAAREHVDEVLVVDDGSTDGTPERARAAGATVVEHDQNRGYGRALKTIFEEAASRDVDRLVVLDADGQHDPANIPRLLDAHDDQGADVVIGSRFCEGAESDAPLYRRFGLWVINGMVNLSMGRVHGEARIGDAQSGFRSYDGAVVSSLAQHGDVIDDRMAASLDILYHAEARGYTTAEVPTTITYDVPDASTHNPVAHGLGLVANVLGYLGRSRPLSVLGLPGALLALVGVSIGYLALAAGASGGLLDLGSVVLAAALVLAGTLSSFLSVVRYSLAPEGVSE